MQEAPLYSEVADGPADGRAFWLTTSDDVRIRAGLWRIAGAAGTVILFPGRTEYIEKYGRAAGDFAQSGFSTLVVDWRGQGLSDRLIRDPMSGYVHHFGDYQKDVTALVAAASELDLPKPWYLLGHSMGGCIGFRAAREGMPVVATVFSAPMWGIQLSTTLRPVAWSLSWSSRNLGFGHAYAPGTTAEHYTLTEPFETNKLTHDPEMYDYMAGQLRVHPELGIGGPSLRWLYEALRETNWLSRVSAPLLPCLTILGSEEDIVDTPRIYERIANWPNAHLEVVKGAKHEVLMETVHVRKALFDQIAAFYRNAGQLADDQGSRATT